MMRKTSGSLVLAASFLAVTALHRDALANSYPTETVADYVIGCLAANGETQDNLRRCSCSIDAVASIIPYETYEQADTIIRMSGVPGDNTSLFRNTPMLKQIVDDLRLAQIEADFRCF